MTQYWHGSSDGVVWHPNGSNLTYSESDARIRPELIDHSLKMDQGVFEVGGDVFMAYGFGLTSPAMIVGPDGVIIIDPPEDVEKGRRAWEALREYSDKPIRAVMYSHWHLDHYGGVRGFVDEEAVASGQVQIIAHKTFLDNVVASSSGGDGPIIAARVGYSLGTLLDIRPEGRINGGLGPDFEAQNISLIPPTVLVDDELDMEIAGIRVHFEWLPSEAPDEIIAWFPDLEVLHTAETLQGESFPNLHTIRGSKYRDPELWFKSLDRMRRFPAKFMVPSHGRPVSGYEEVADVITSYRDAIQFVFDQTIRYMNKGYLPHELVEAVQLPDRLAHHLWLGDFYGGVKHSVRQIYVGQLGWFEGDPTFLDPIDRVESSRRMIGLMGGEDKVVDAAQRASASGDHQWSAELLTHIIRVDTDNQNARRLKAENLRQIGFAVTNTNWRSWYMTSAQELDGTLDHSKALDIVAPDLVRVFPVARIIESLRFRLDAAKAINVEITLGVRITGEAGGDFSLIIRRGVLEYSEQLPNKPDMSIELSHRDLLGLLAPPSGAGEETPDLVTPLERLLKSVEDGTVTMPVGTVANLENFFSHFDPPAAGPIPITLK